MLPRFTHASRITHQVLLALLSLTATAAIDETQLPPPATVTVDFARDIKPILLNSCYKCHGGERPKGHFLLTSREAALKGGTQGVDIVAGQSAKSPLIHFVARMVPDVEMPPEGKGTPLTPEQIGLLRAWIDQGAIWEQGESEPELLASASLTVGFTTVNGSKEQFRELNWQREGWNRGLEEFELTQKSGDGSKVTSSGHILRDDYKVTLEASKNDLGFVRFGWSEYRKYYDGAGGVNSLISSSPFDLNTDLHKDIGKASVDVGLTLPNWPRFVVGYEQQWQNGTESTLEWGSVSEGTNTAKIYPAYKTVSERTHILKFDADYEVADWRFTDSFRGEWYKLSTTSWSDSGYTNGGSGMATTVVKEEEHHFQGANTVHVEKQVAKWWFASGGYLYSKFTGDASLNSSNLNAMYLSTDPALPQWQTDPITLERETHVFSVASMFGPWEGLTLSLASQNEWTRQQGMGSQSGQIALPFMAYYFALTSQTNSSDLDSSTFSQTASLRFTTIPFTTLYADARMQQERIGQYEEENGGLTEFVRNTDTSTDLKDVRVGFNTSPWRRVSLSGYYRRYDSEADYDTTLKESGLNKITYEGYSGFIRWRDILADEAELRLSLQPAAWLKTSFSYKRTSEDYQARTDSANYTDSGGVVTTNGITPGGSLLAGRYDAHSVSANATLTPWRRVFLSTTFSYQNSRTVTFANGSDSVVPYQGDTWSALASATYVVDNRTDLSASYLFSLARFAQDSSATSSTYDLDYTLHNVSVSLSRKLSRNLTGSLRYGYYRYDEPTSGGANNYDAHAVYATLTYRWP